MTSSGMLVTSIWLMWEAIYYLQTHCGCRVNVGIITFNCYYTTPYINTIKDYKKHKNGSVKKEKKKRIFLVFCFYL